MKILKHIAKLFGLKQEDDAQMTIPTPKFILLPPAGLPQNQGGKAYALFQIKGLTIDDELDLENIAVREAATKEKQHLEQVLQAEPKSPKQKIKL